MLLQNITWQNLRDDQPPVVLIPTGSLEQHGPHLPLFTDTLIVTAIAQAIEQTIPDIVLLTPTLWLGASTHHLAFPGSLSNTHKAYIDSIQAIVHSLRPHGFHTFYILNGHRGNTDLNRAALRELRAADPRLTLGEALYADFIPQSIYDQTLTGRYKTIRHACEAEASLMLHLHPDLVHRDKLRDDGLATDPEIIGLLLHFDEITEEGSLGDASQATAEKGRALFTSAVEGAVQTLTRLAQGPVLKTPVP